MKKILEKILVIIFLSISFTLYQQPKTNIPNTDTRQFTGFIQIFAIDYNTPALSYYILTRQQVQQPGIKNRPSWRTDFKYKSVKSSDYTNTGFDRGHNVPDADMDYSQMTLNDTYYMSNVTPQYPNFNRYKWAALEDYGRDLTMQYNKVFIITGNILNKDLAFLRNKIQIPTYCWKVFYYKDEFGKLQNEQYLMPNSQSCKDYTYYKITLDHLEGLSNFTVGPLDWILNQL